MRATLNPKLILSLPPLLLSANTLADSLPNDETFSITAGGYRVSR